MIAHAAQRRLTTSTTTVAQGGPVTQIASGDATSTPGVSTAASQSAQANILSAQTGAIASTANSQASGMKRPRGRPPGSKDKQPRAKKGQGTRKTRKEGVYGSISKHIRFTSLNSMLWW